MELLYPNEHLNCSYYNQQHKPSIKVVNAAKGDKNNLPVSYNEIVFISEGHIQYNFQNQSTYEGLKGQIIFRSAGNSYSYEAKDDSIVVIFQLSNPILLCHNFSIEKLYNIKKKIFKIDGNSEPKTDIRIGTMEITPRIRHFLEGVIDCISDGMQCQHWFELKTNELFSYFRSYYSKEEMCDFFYSILSGDTIFSEHVRQNWHRFRSVKELADSLNLTCKQFSKRFIKIFGQPPYQWMLENRARKSYGEIISTNKPFKYIAFENGFTDDTQFTRFCKIKFGKTPTELREGATINPK